MKELALNDIDTAGISGGLFSTGLADSIEGAVVDGTMGLAAGSLVGGANGGAAGSGGVLGIGEIGQGVGLVVGAAVGGLAGAVYGFAAGLSNSQGFVDATLGAMLDGSLLPKGGSSLVVS